MQQVRQPSPPKSPSPPSKSPEQKSPKKQQSILQKLLKSQKTFQLQYEIIKQLMHQLDNPKQCNFQLFKQLYQNLSKEIKNTLLFQRLNYKIWNDQTLPVEIREKTQFFRIVSEWIVIFQMKVNQLKKFSQMVEFLNTFFTQEVHGIFQKIVLIDEIYEDLIQMFGKRFWKLQQDPDQPLSGPPTKQQGSELLKLLNLLIQYYQFLLPQQNQVVHNCQLYLLSQKCTHYIQFIYCSLEYILSINSGKKSQELYLQKHQEMELTRIALIFLQRNDVRNGYLTTQKCIKLIQMLMLRTSKIVRYAMVIDYVRYYEFLEKNEMDQILEQLQNMVYFRELIIGHSQIGQAGLTTSPNINHPLQTLVLPARTKQRILLSHEPEYGKYSIIQLQFTIEGGDINLAIYNIKNNKQILHWKQQKTEDRRIDIMLKEQGLYIVEIDNLYSWIKSKKVNYRIEQYCVGVSEPTQSPGKMEKEQEIQLGKVSRNVDQQNRNKEKEKQKDDRKI